VICTEALPGSWGESAPPWLLPILQVHLQNCILKSLFIITHLSHESLTLTWKKSLEVCDDTTTAAICLLQDWALVTTAEHQAPHSLGGSTLEKSHFHTSNYLPEMKSSNYLDIAVGYPIRWMAFKNNILSQTS